MYPPSYGNPPQIVVAFSFSTTVDSFGDRVPVASNNRLFVRRKAARKKRRVFG
jgi:hypothetical protein